METGRRRSSWQFTNVVDDSNPGLPRTNPAQGGQGRT